MPKEYKNIEMERMLAALEPLLSRRDIVGYAAARNTRILQSETAEYFDYREELITKYGEPVTDSDGNATGQYELRFDSPKWPTYEREITEYAMIEHRPNLFKIPVSKTIDALSGQEMLDLAWMLEFDDENA